MSRKRRFERLHPSPGLEKSRDDSRSSSGLRYGLHAVRAALEQPALQVMALWLDQTRMDQSLQKLAKLAFDRGLKAQPVKREELDELVPGARHQGVVARCSVQSALTEEGLLAFLDQLGTPPLLLLLDGVQDPHNLGACLRTAEAAGVHGVVVPKDRAAGLTAVARKVASGAAERVPLVRVTNLARVMRALRERGLWLVGAVVGGTHATLYETDLQGPLGLVLGAEDRGLRRLTQEHCDCLVQIPMQGAVGSLNVSVAAGVCLFEAQRQRGLAPSLKSKTPLEGG
ncbi:23S rRNA (guanosine(2251)-2'-O)-methyltransferase RlmB [Nitrosococcus watsonii]|uniref:23S rRNA (guanosine-2'-O-)-methyltransferase RlmB n=1 Tax=Nitrosococcus watsoni (strain C-113) TaxID=105559 RepID=D8KBJ6_NITWC|nr:23S rRNA (guanosine(2251)-2'-O)-methyltransferase RlmB [Nitrosococcus watsonii]ADJ29643.1 RNA methyltransferase, TrmH family, group 3 [Nitrosococcus watsonii C-113]